MFPTTLTDLWTLTASSIKTEAIRLALDSALFDQLAQPSTVEQFALRQQWEPQQATALLELLWSMKLLTRDAAGYQTSAEMQAYLCQTGERYIGDSWRFRYQSLRDVGQQLAALMQQTSGTSPPAARMDAGWAQAAQEQRALTVDRACDIVGALPEFPQAKTLLDVGGGPGMIAIGLTQRHPTLQGVVFDLPQTAAVAQENIIAAGLHQRLSTASGDFSTQPFAAGYADIIWCSSFLHFVEDITTSIAQLFNALTPGGVLVAVHAEIASNQEDAASVLPFYLPLMLRGRRVTREGELASLLCDAGFSRVETRRHQPFPMSPLTVLIARK
ncbi:SAM-dependent methyltransferase [Candidatus Symbiopectobacterium sp. 'North America']|uniref:class I SAM-dependent methyltransferase n=1 Tax=Candidatus Symbiopectobacterium sp. 'North America' TaxID=2794574 RepID=UPI0018CA0BD7|nr:class I SAM-dependent methyltransferase [Candidatus Symbiopectobacterium sp. 'North America']MBG6244364.1 SAM-dependent methyltransferase [Candidatus Symbiopectobacterium sp. 'North America']